MTRSSPFFGGVLYQHKRRVTAPCIVCHLVSARDKTRKPVSAPFQTLAVALACVSCRHSLTPSRITSSHFWGGGQGGENETARDLVGVRLCRPRAPFGEGGMGWRPGDAWLAVWK
jgi:hypothetical protein